ncbi:MAG: hypothetical protein M1831_001103 [Alyxoria varia]|nr:MAG: hypothetical protein M1831_001103 [Alyxoria varia]
MSTSRHVLAHQLRSRAAPLADLSSQADAMLERRSSNKEHPEGDTVSLTPRSALDHLPANASMYTHGLTGVDQEGDYLFVNVLIAFTFGVCAFSLGLRLFKLGNNHLRHLFATGSGRDRQTYWVYNQTTWWPWLKRYLAYAPIWSKRHNREIQLSSAVSFGTLPSRFQLILLTIYFISNIAYCGALHYDRGIEGVMAELRGRTGALATYNMIPTILFAMRNNPFIPLLKVSFDTFNLLHRWTARIVITESVAHFLAWAVLKVATEGWKSFNMSIQKSSFIGSGFIAFVVMFFMGIQGWAPVRHAFYETFLNVHRLAAVAAIAAVWVHVKEGHLPQVPWCKLMVAIWVLEFVVRMFRISYHNFSRQRGISEVTVEALPSDACRLTFHLSRHWHFKPGTHVHAYVPRFSWWGSHPFSIAWADDHAVGNFNEKLPSSTHDTDLDKANKVRTSISMITRARTGFTRQLYEAAEKCPNGVLTTKGAIEGPYGGHESLDSYGTVLLFAGGVGITHQLSYIRHLVAGCAEGTVAAKKIILVWTVPNTEALEWVRPWMDEILKMPGRRDVLRIMLFVTKPKSMQEVVMSGTGTVQMFPGRCNPQTILDKEFVERIGAMAVTVCGPGGLADSVRHAARRRTTLGSLDFIEEAFTY